MAIEDLFPEQSKYHESYNQLKDGADEVARIVEERLRKLLPDYFWIGERSSLQISDPRIKSLWSIDRKLNRKIAEGKIVMRPDRPKHEAILAHVEDFVGIRIIAASKQYFPRLVQMIRDDQECWDVIEAKIYTQDPKEMKEYNELGLTVDSQKTSGYCGIHFLLSIHDRQPNQVRKVEVQVRTKFQDAWQSFEHSIYKVEDDLPPKLKEMRSSLARQSEATAESYERMLDYSHELVIDKKIEPPDQMKRWADLYGMPFEHVWNVVLIDGTEIYAAVISSTEWLRVDKDSVKNLLGDNWEAQPPRSLPVDLMLTHYKPLGNLDSHEKAQEFTNYFREKRELAPLTMPAFVLRPVEDL